LVGVSDSAQVAQRLGNLKINPATIEKEIEMLKRSEVKIAKTTELVAAYNQITGKAIKKFANRAAGEKQLLKLLPQEESEMATKTNGKGKGKTKVKSTKPRAARVTFTKAQVVAAGGEGRLNATSLRQQVIDCMKAHFAGSFVTVEDLSAKIGFDARPSLAHLARKGWVRVS
jgi:hypothetical protein